MAVEAGQGSVASYIPVGLDMRPAEAQANAFFNKARSLNLNSNLPLGSFSRSAQDFEKSLMAAESRVLAFTSTAAALYTVKNALDGIVSSTIAVEKDLTDVNVVLNLSKDKFEYLSNSLFEIGNNTGKSFDEAAKASVEFSRQGLGLEETLKRTNDALVLNRLSGLGVVESTKAITTTINSFTKELLNSTLVVSKFAAVDQAFAVSSADLAEAVSRVGSSAQEAGVNLDQLIGIVTAAQQTTGRGGAVIGEAFKTIFTRVSSNKTINDLRDLGVEISATQTGIEKLAAISKAVKLNPELRNQIEELAGGKYRINILTAAVNDLSSANGVYARSSKISSDATDEAIKRNERYNDTLASLLNTTKNKLIQTASNIGSKTIKPTLQNDLPVLNDFLDSINDSQNSKKAGFSIGRALFDGIGSFFAGPGLIGIGLILGKILYRFGQFTKDAFTSFIQIQESGKGVVNIYEKISTLFTTQSQAIESLVDRSKNRLAVENQILSVIEKQYQINNRIASQGIAGAALGSILPSARGVVSNDSRSNVLNNNLSFGALNGIIQAATFGGGVQGTDAPTKSDLRNLSNLPDEVRNAFKQEPFQISPKESLPLELSKPNQQTFNSNDIAAINAANIQTQQLFKSFNSFLDNANQSVSKISSQKSLGISKESNLAFTKTYKEPLNGPESNIAGFSNNPKVTKSIHDILNTAFKEYNANQIVENIKSRPSLSNVLSNEERDAINFLENLANSKKGQNIVPNPQTFASNIFEPLNISRYQPPISLGSTGFGSFQSNPAYLNNVANPVAKKTYLDSSVKNATSIVNQSSQLAANGSFIGASNSFSSNANNQSANINIAGRPYPAFSRFSFNESSPTLSPYPEGFIPKFQPTNSKGIGNKLSNASIVAPFIAGAVQELIGNETRTDALRGALVGAAGSAGGAFGLGTFAFGNPIGGAALAAGTAGVELIKIKGQFYDESKRIQEEIDKVAQSLNRAGDAFQQYLQLTDKLSEVYSGNIKANIDQIIDLEKRKKKSVAEVEKELNVDFDKLSPEDRQKKLLEFNNRQSNKIEVLEFGRSASKFNEQNKTSFESVRDSAKFLKDIFSDTLKSDIGQSIKFFTPGGFLYEATNGLGSGADRHNELVEKGQFTEKALPQAENLIKGILSQKNLDTGKTVIDVIADNEKLRDSILNSSFDTKKSLDSIVQAIKDTLPSDQANKVTETVQKLFQRDVQIGSAFAKQVPIVLSNGLNQRKSLLERVNTESGVAESNKISNLSLVKDIAEIERLKLAESEYAKLVSSRNIRTQEIGDVQRGLNAQTREIFADKFQDNFEKLLDTFERINSRFQTESENLGNTFQSEVANALRTVGENLKRKATEILNNKNDGLDPSEKAKLAQQTADIAKPFLNTANQSTPFTREQVSSEIEKFQDLIVGAQKKIDTTPESSTQRNLLISEMNNFKSAMFELQKSLAAFDTGLTNSKENAEKDRAIAGFIEKAANTQETFKGALNVFGDRTGQGSRVFEAKRRLEIADSIEGDIEGVDSALKDLKTILSNAGKPTDNISNRIESRVKAQANEALPESALKLPSTIDLIQELKSQDGLYASIQERENAIINLRTIAVNLQKQINKDSSKALEIEKQFELSKKTQIALDAQLAFNANRIGIEDLKRFNSAKREQEIKTNGALSENSINQAFNEEFIPENTIDIARRKEANAKLVIRNGGQREVLGNQLFTARQDLNIAEQSKDVEGQKAALLNIKDIFEGQKLQVPQDVQNKLQNLTKQDIGKNLEEFPILLDRVRNQLKDQSQLFISLKEKEDFILDVEVKRSDIQNKIKLGIVDSIQAQKEYNAEVSKALAKQAEIAFSNDQISGDELRSQKSAARLDEKRATGRLSGQSISDSFFDEFKYNGRDFYDDLEKGASSTAKSIKSEFSSAFKSFADGSKTAGQAFTDFLSNIGKKFADFAFDIAINSIFSSVFGGLGKSLGGFGGLGRNMGGEIYGPTRYYSTGGSVLGGSGSKDDVPAVLTAGEYVVKKASVQKYGEDLLNAINDGQASFDGKNTIIVAGKSGSDINAKFKNTYTLNDSSRPSSGIIDYDPNLSSAALDDENNPQNQIRFNKERDLGEYLRNVRQFNKRKDQAAFGSLLQAGISLGTLGIASALGVFSPSSARTISSSATGNTITSSPYQAGLSYSNTTIGGGFNISPTNSLNSAAGATAGLSYSSSSYLNRFYGGNFSYGGRSNGGEIRYYAGGGDVLKSDSSDNVRTMLTGGEFVFGHYSTKKFPKRMYDQINSGNAKIVRKAETGGSIANSQSSTVSNNAYTGSNSFDKLNDTIARLDNTINSLNDKSSNNGKTNGENVTIQVNNTFTTNISSNGESKIQSSSSINSDGKKNNDAKSSDNSEGVKQLNAKIETTVRKVIVEESRIGGLVYNIVKSR